MANQTANFNTCARKWRKTAVKDSIEKPIPPDFVNLTTILVQDCTRESIYAFHFTLRVLKNVAIFTRKHCF